MDQSNEYTFEIDDKVNKPIQSNNLIVPESIVRMRILYRWGLVLEDEKDIQCISKLKDINYVSTGNKDIFSPAQIKLELNHEFQTTQSNYETSKLSETVERIITDSESISNTSQTWNNSNKKSNPSVDINDFLFDISFLPKIPNYKWVRRPIRNGYLYAYKKIKDQTIKMSEYLIHEGKLLLNSEDLIGENKKSKDADRNNIQQNIDKFDDYWHSDTIEKENQLAEYGFAYSECRWSIQYIEYLVDLNNKDRDKRFQKINIEEYYSIFKESILKKTNKFVEFQSSNKDLYKQFSLADEVRYSFQSGQLFNIWELLRFDLSTINNYVEQDVEVMTQSLLNTATSKNEVKEPVMILNATLVDHLGAIDDIIEDLTISNALFNSLVETLGTPYSAYDKYEENLKALIQGALNEDQDTRVSPKIANQLDDTFSNNTNLEEKKTSVLVQNKYTSSFNDTRRLTKMLSYTSKVVNPGKTVIKEEDAKDLHLSALLLYKILYSPESKKIISSDEFKKTCTEQTNKVIEPAKKMKKYRDCVQQEKIKKVLAVRERAELRNLILKVKNSLGYFLTEQVLLLYPVLDDYCINTESRKLEGKERFNLIIGLLTINPRTVDRSLDIVDEETEKRYEEQIYYYDDFLVKCFTIPHIEPAGYNEDKLLQILHTPIDLDKLLKDKSFQSQIDKETGKINAAKAFCITLSTIVNLASHFEGRINLDLLDLSKQIDYNTNKIDNANSDLTEKKKEVKQEQHKYDRFEKQTNRTINNTTIREESLSKLQALFDKNVEEIAKIGSDPVITLQAQEIQLNSLLEDGANRGSYHLNSLKKDIAISKAKLAKLKELEKEKQILDKKKNKSQTDIDRRKVVIADMEATLGEKRNKLNLIEDDVRSLEKEISIREMHHENLLNRHRNLMERKFKSKIIRFNEKVEATTNHPAFKTLSLVLSFTSFIRSIDDFGEDDKATVSAIGAFSDLTSILGDITLSVAKQIKSLPGTLGGKVGNTFVRGATAVSYWFGVVGTLTSTVIAFMDMKASFRKGDSVSGWLNMGAGIAGALSSMSLIIIGVSGSANIVLVSIGIYGLLLMLIITVLIMIFASDDFEIFLKATVFSSDLPLAGIVSNDPYQVRYQLCICKTSYGKNNCIYEEAFNSGFRVKDGEANPSKRKIDLKVFKNMIEYIYNLMVGFGAQAMIKYKDPIEDLKGAKAHIYNQIKFTLFFNAYDSTSGEMDLQLNVFTVGIKKFMDRPNNSDLQKDTFVEIIGTNNGLRYNDINPLKKKLGVGIQPSFMIVNEIKNHIKKHPNMEIDKDKICYVLFFRFKMSNGVWWPFNKDESEDSVYVAITELIHDQSKYVTTSKYAAINSDSYRHTINNSGVYIGTKKEILVYLKNLELQKR